MTTCVLSLACYVVVPVVVDHLVFLACNIGICCLYVVVSRVSRIGWDTMYALIAWQSTWSGTIKSPDGLSCERLAGVRLVSPQVIGAASDLECWRLLRMSCSRCSTVAKSAIAASGSWVDGKRHCQVRRDADSAHRAWAECRVSDHVESPLWSPRRLDAIYLQVHPTASLHYPNP